MSSFAQLVKISPDPSVIYFQPPYSIPSRSVLILTNQTKRSLVLKVKTTVPELYQVSPTLAVIEPEARLNISITLMPTAPGELMKSIGRSAHRFLFMASFKPEVSQNNKTFDFGGFWKRCPARDIAQQKLRCEFDDTAMNNAGQEGEGEGDETAAGNEFPAMEVTARPSPPTSSRYVTTGSTAGTEQNRVHPLSSLPNNSASGSDTNGSSSMLGRVGQFVQQNVMFTIGIVCLVTSIIIVKW